MSYALCRTLITLPTKESCYGDEMKKTLRNTTISKMKADKFMPDSRKSNWLCFNIQN